MTRIRRAFIWIAALSAVAATALLVTSMGTAQEQPTPRYTFKLTIGGAERAPRRIFRVDVGGSSNQVVTQTDADAEGKSRVQKLPGQLEWSTLEVRAPVSAGPSLWAWRKQIIDGKWKDAREEVTLELLDSQGSRVAGWTYRNAWPAGYSVSTLTRGSKATPYEILTIAHEGMERE